MKNFRNKSESIYYNRMYFIRRDVLDISIAEGIKKFMRDHRLQRVLDVGCGSGKIVKFLNGSRFDAFGCDVSGIAVEMARKLNGKDSIVHASATKLPSRFGKFDLVISISMIEHITKNQVAKFLREVKRVLKPGGYIFLVTPNFASPLRIIQGKQWGGYADPTHINFYSPRNLATTLKLNGFYKPKINIGIPYKKSIGKAYLAHIKYIPELLKNEICYLFFSTPLRFMRNSFWISAQKKYEI